jgi:hypothetical protein
MALNDEFNTTHYYETRHLAISASLLQSNFLKPSTRKEIFRALKTSSGEDTGYGLGWYIAKMRKAGAFITTAVAASAFRRICAFIRERASCSRFFPI